MDKVWISIALIPTITAVVQGLKGFFKMPWCSWILSLIHLGFIVPYIPNILNVLLSIAAGIALYGAEGLTGNEIWQMVLMIFGIAGMAIGADGTHKLVAKASGIVK